MLCACGGAGRAAAQPPTHTYAVQSLATRRTAYGCGAHGGESFCPFNEDWGENVFLPEPIKCWSYVAPPSLPSHAV